LNLFILRHGEAGRRIPTSSRDSERALTVAGEKEIEEIAESLKKLHLKFDSIVTSPLKRSYQTAAIVAKELGATPERWDELKPEGDRQALYRRFSKMKGPSSVLLVGHEPYLSTMIGEVIGEGGISRISIKKGGLAKVVITSLSPKPKGELRWLLTPKQVRRM
jgi:phosphohistidine phosphatase